MLWKQERAINNTKEITTTGEAVPQTTVRATEETTGGHVICASKKIILLGTVLNYKVV